MDFYQYDKQEHPLKFAETMAEVRKCAISVILEFGYIGTGSLADIVIERLSIESMDVHGVETYYRIVGLCNEAKANYVESKSDYITANGQTKIMF